MNDTAAASKPTDSDVEVSRKLANRRSKAFRRVQFAKKAATTAVAGLGLGLAFQNSTTPLDGPFDSTAKHDRWSIKTSIDSAAAQLAPKAIEIAALEHRGPVQLSVSDESTFDAKLVPKVAGDEFYEGEVVSTEGYIHLVAFESDDSDYHIQMNENATNEATDLLSCVVVEIPHPKAAASSALGDDFAAARKLIRDKCFAGAQPTGTVKQPLHVRVTGQLFFDLYHMFHSKDPGGGRGKAVDHHPMKATTIWEIHPVTRIELLP